MAEDVEISGPLPGEKFTLQRWREIFGDATGIISDTDGTAYDIALPSGSDDVEIGSPTIPSVGLVHGHPHIIPAGQTQSVTVPPSDGGGPVGRTDRIVLRRDPATYGTAPGPIRLTILTGTEGSLDAPVIDPDTDLRLWRIRRIEGQGLNQALVTAERMWLGRPVTVEPGATLPPAAPLGTRATRDGTIYRRDLVAGTVDWVVESEPVETLRGLAATASPGAPGWERRGAALTRDGSRRELHFEARRAGVPDGGNLTFATGTGGIADQQLAVLHGADRPASIVTGSARVSSRAGSTYWGGAHITPGGLIILNSGPPGITIGPAGPDVTVIIDAAWRVS